MRAAHLHAKNPIFHVWVLMLHTHKIKIRENNLNKSQKSKPYLAPICRWRHRRSPPPLVVVVAVTKAALPAPPLPLRTLMAMAAADPPIAPPQLSSPPLSLLLPTTSAREGNSREREERRLEMKERVGDNMRRGGEREMVRREKMRQVKILGGPLRGLIAKLYFFMRPFKSPA